MHACARAPFPNTNRNYLNAATSDFVSAFICSIPIDENMRKDVSMHHMITWTNSKRIRHIDAEKQKKKNI
jgi:hypothetical protein